MIDPGTALLVFAACGLLAPLLLWPRSGLIPRLLRLSRLDERVRLEDAIKHIYKCQRARSLASLESVAGQLAVSTSTAAALLSKLSEMGLVRLAEEGPALTPDGERTAVRVVRTHRLWERYLADRTGVPAVEWHDEADRMEHSLSDEQVEELDSRLGRPPWDPHGDPIPTASGVVPPAHGVGLMSVPSGKTVEVVHLEDEPREIYDGLVRDGFVLGGRLEVVDKGTQGVRVRYRGRAWTVDPVAASNVTVRELPEGARPDAAPTTLLDAGLGEQVTVLAIAQTCQGTQRRRLLDLGFVRGAHVTSELVSATGDPVAYRIRGALIALRRTQAAQVVVERPARPNRRPDPDAEGHADQHHDVEDVA